MVESVRRQQVDLQLDGGWARRLCCDAADGRSEGAPYPPRPTHHWRTSRLSRSVRRRLRCRHWLRDARQALRPRARRPAGALLASRMHRHTQDSYHGRSRPGARFNQL